jgi:hypothetical protein
LRPSAPKPLGPTSHVCSSSCKRRLKGSSTRAPITRQRRNYGGCCGKALPDPLCPRTAAHAAATGVTVSSDEHVLIRVDVDLQLSLLGRSAVARALYLQVDISRSAGCWLAGWLPACLSSNLCAAVDAVLARLLDFGLTALSVTPGRPVWYLPHRVTAPCSTRACSGSGWAGAGRELTAQIETGSAASCSVMRLPRNVFSGCRPHHSEKFCFDVHLCYWAGPSELQST